jgi:hypothetical protein
MNERIKEIMFQSGLGYMSSAHPILVEKFAELIVRECADMAESFHRHQYDMTGNLELHEFIREHFGVEE